MLNLDALRMNADNEDFERLRKQRQTLIDKAMEEGDVETLNQIAAIDKANQQWLQQKKERLQQEIKNLSKINQYIR